MPLKTSRSLPRRCSPASRRLIVDYHHRAGVHRFSRRRRLFRPYFSNTFCDARRCCFIASHPPTTRLVNQTKDAELCHDSLSQNRFQRPAGFGRIILIKGMRYCSWQSSQTECNLRECDPSINGVYSVSTGSLE